MAEQTPGDSYIRAWTDGGTQKFFWLVVAVVLVLDLSSKWCAFRFIETIGDVPEEKHGVVIVQNVLEFKKTTNRGAALGLGQGGTWVFVIATFVAVGFIVQLFAKSRSEQRVLHLLLAMSLGGALGNLYDRLVFGYVRDFIAITAEIREIPVWPWVFNIADVALVVGIGLLLVGWTFGKLDLQYARQEPSGGEREGKCETVDEVEQVDRS